MIVCRFLHGWILVVLTLVCLAVPAGATEAKPLWMAVGCGELLEPLQPLVEHRRGEGFETFLSSKPVAEALETAPRRPDFLLLVGDDEPGKEHEPWYLPAKRKPLYRWREVQRKTFDSDTAWGDLDGDDVPDVPVGRIPARTAAEVGVVVRKLLAFERRPPNTADLGLPVWGGSPDFSPTVDAVLVDVMLGMLEANGPKWLDPWVTLGSLHSPLCGWPPDKPRVFTERMKRGGLLIGLMGHAHADGFFSMAFEGKLYYYTADDAREALSQGPPTAPLFFISCESGYFSRPRRCMAEAFLFFPGGPVATIAATTESHPLPNTYTGMAMMAALGEGDKRLGPLWLRTLKRGAKMDNFLLERVLRDAEGKLEDPIDVAKLRRDHPLMYGMLGDPATKLKLPDPLKVKVERTETGWQWTVERPPGATRLEVSRRAGKLPVAELTLDEPPGSPDEAWQVFDKANAALRYRPVTALAADRPWQGAVDQPGRLRFVALGPKAFYATAVVLDPNTPRASGR